MSEQQQLHHTQIFNPAATGRPPDASWFHIPLYQQQNTRFGTLNHYFRLIVSDSVNVPPNGTMMSNPFYPYYPFRAADPIPYLFRSIPPPQMGCALPSQIQEAQMPGQIPTTAHNDLGQIAFVPQPFQAQVQYPHVMQPNQTLSYNTNSNQRVYSSTPFGETQSQTTATRRKRPLQVLHPLTHVVIDITSGDEDHAPDAPPKPAVTAESVSHSVPSVVVEDAQEPVMEVASNPSANIPDVPAETNVTSECPDIPDLVEPPAELKSDSVLSLSSLDKTECPVVRNGESLVTAGAGTGFPEMFSSSDSEDSDEDHVSYRRMYNRDMLLSYKNSPVSKVPLAQLAIITEIYPVRREHRLSHRQPDRIIRLPTGMAVKRVEGAFIPSQLRKKEGNGEADHQKLLSRELNVILNRVSDGNLLDTVSDIKKLNLSSAEDMNMLAKLVFQKGIRQSKYSKVFASLCKELKGFEVQGSEPFESIIFRQVQELFATPLDTLIAELNGVIDAKIKAAKDDAIKRILEDDRETNVVKKVESYYGNMTFLAELYLCGLVKLKTIIDCLKKLKDSPAPESLNSMLILLNICGQDLEPLAKNIIDACFIKLNSHLKSGKLPNHQLYKIQELCDLRARGWKEVDRIQSNPPPPSNVPRRQGDEKPRRPTVQPPPETKRKTPYTANPVIPSSLAVTQQPCESRKLRPTIHDWTQGSGPRKSSTEDGSHQSHPTNVIQNRSRESSPRVQAAPQNVWAARQARMQGGINTGVVAAQNDDPLEDYSKIVDRNRGAARSVLTMLKANEDGFYTSFADCKMEERSALLHAFFELLMDERTKERSAAGVMCLSLLDKRLITGKDLISACEGYLVNCDDGWLEDYPFGFKYLAEIFQHFIKDGQDHFQLLLQLLKPLGKNSPIVLAHCLNLSASRLGEDCLAAKFHSHNLDWLKLGVKDDLLSFATKHKVLFTLRAFFDSKLKDLDALLEITEASSGKITSFCKQMSVADLPANFIRSCVRIMVSKSKNYSRQNIDDLVLNLGILVDHKAERELLVLESLREYETCDVSTDQWLKSLLDRKVISSDAFESWTKTNDVGDSVTRNFRIRDQ
ncbi:hypothetical protein P879_07821 [Paragonimus westermani]|uniref:MIF4G domain-containing protein n=1 Tax=Paragonimus westermani TaxID=34504 RepID=A0A8T0DD09_9TREM|nr:hypothetical protein P879_07821 [Paragonimus westermani]